MEMGTAGHTQDELAKSIFLDALEIASERDRRAYLDRRCGPDHRLRAEVEELLRHQGLLGDYLERPALDSDATRMSPRPHSPRPPGPSSARTSCGIRSAKGAWAWSTWPSRPSPSAARWRSRSSSRAWTRGR